MASLAIRTAVAVVAVLAMLGGGALLAVDRAERDDDGYYSSDAIAVSSGGYAIASDPLDVDLHGGGEEFVVDHLLGRARVQATSTNGKPVLVGVAARKDLDAYLARVATTRVTDLERGSHAVSHDVPGGALTGPPAAQDFWKVVATGTGRQTLDWNVGEGEWTVAVFNADGSRDVSAEVVVGADSDVLQWLGFGLLAAGLLGLAGAVASLHRQLAN